MMISHTYGKNPQKLLELPDMPYTNPPLLEVEVPGGGCRRLSGLTRLASTARLSTSEKRFAGDDRRLYFWWLQRPTTFVDRAHTVKILFSKVYPTFTFYVKTDASLGD